MLTHIDLFSGIGGFALAARWAGFQTVAFVEVDDYAQAVLKKNFMADAAELHSDGSEFHGRSNGESSRKISKLGNSGPTLYADIRDFDGTTYRGATLLTGGFPCQPFSQAGKRAGTQDDRHLWPEMHRVIRESKPAWVVAENVAGIVTMELDNVLSDLEGEGYAVQPFIIPACAVDARHRRDRVWIVAHANERTRIGGEPQSGKRQMARSDEAKRGESNGVDSRCSLLQGRRTEESTRWLPEPDVGRVAHGVPNRVDRLKGLGNAIVPQVAYEILRVIAARG